MPSLSHVEMLDGPGLSETLLDWFWINPSERPRSLQLQRAGPSERLPCHHPKSCNWNDFDPLPSLPAHTGDSGPRKHQIIEAARQGFFDGWEQVAVLIERHSDG